VNTSVRFQPVLPWRLALSGAKPGAVRPFPLDQPRVVTTFSGTAAIYQAGKSLRLPEGATVLVPSYNCGHEIEPFLRLGLRVECYRVMADLQIDLADVERRMRKSAGALLITHYFGFGQPLEAIRALCDRHGVMLIEDCAHALFSDNAARNLGRVGDAAVYSMRKSLPLPHGGAVLFNNSSLPLPAPLTPPPALVTHLKTLDLVKKSTLHDFAGTRSLRSLLQVAAVAPFVIGGNVLQRLQPKSSAGCYDPDDDDYAFNTSILSWDADPAALRILDAIDWRSIAERRLANYRVLAAGISSLRGFRLLLPYPHERTCPLFLPVATNKRLEVFRHLVSHRIHAGIWWDQEHPAVPWSDYPEARELKQRVLALPVHQDLDANDLQRMLAALASAPV